MLKRFGSLLAVLFIAAALATAALQAQDVGDPNAAIPDDVPLSSTAAVVTAAIFGTHLIKRAFARIPALAAVPVWVYTILLAIALTYVGNVVFGTLAGNLWLLIVQAVVNAALASGVREWGYNFTKPLSDSSTAREATGAIVPSRVVPVILLAVVLEATACSAKVGPQLVAVEDATHDALAGAQDAIEVICDPMPTSLTCREANAALVPVWDAQLAFNRAVRDGRLSAIATLIEKAGALMRAVANFQPSELRETALRDLQQLVNAAFKGAQ